MEIRRKRKEQMKRKVVNIEKERGGLIDKGKEDTGRERAGSMFTIC